MLHLPSPVSRWPLSNRRARGTWGHPRGPGRSVLAMTRFTEQGLGQTPLLASEKSSMNLLRGQGLKTEADLPETPGAPLPRTPNRPVSSFRKEGAVPCPFRHLFPARSSAAQARLYPLPHPAVPGPRPGIGGEESHHKRHTQGDPASTRGPRQLASIAMCPPQGQGGHEPGLWDSLLECAHPTHLGALLQRGVRVTTPRPSAVPMTNPGTERASPKPGPTHREARTPKARPVGPHVFPEPRLCARQGLTPRAVPQPHRPGEPCVLCAAALGREPGPGLGAGYVSGSEPRKPG